MDIKKRETVALEVGGSSGHTWSQIVFEVTAMANNQKKRNQYIKKVATTVFVSLAALVISIVVWLFNLLKLIDMHKFKFCITSTRSLKGSLEYCPCGNLSYH